MAIIDGATSVTNANFALLLGANAILGSALPMMIVLGGLAGLMLALTPSLATLPTSVSTLAGLFAAAPFSLLMGRYGRQPGFILGRSSPPLAARQVCWPSSWGASPCCSLGTS